MKRTTFLLCAMLLAMSLRVLAQEHWGTPSGDWTISVQEGSALDAGQGTPSLEPTVGILFTGRLAGAFDHEVAVGEAQDGGGLSDGWIRGSLGYHFDLDRWRPFVGGNLGRHERYEDKATWRAGPEGGLTYYLTPSAFVMTLIEYDITFDDAARVDEALNDGRFIYSLGFGLRY